MMSIRLALVAALSFGCFAADGLHDALLDAGQIKNDMIRLAAYDALYQQALAKQPKAVEDRETAVRGAKSFRTVREWLWGKSRAEIEEKLGKPDEVIRAPFGPGQHMFPKYQLMVYRRAVTYDLKTSDTFYADCPVKFDGEFVGKTCDLYVSITNEFDERGKRTPASEWRTRRVGESLGRSGPAGEILDSYAHPSK